MPRIENIGVLRRLSLSLAVSLAATCLVAPTAYAQASGTMRNDAADNGPSHDNVNGSADASRNAVTPATSKLRVVYVTRLKHRDRVEDDKVREHLENMGLTVTLVDESAPMSAADGADLVIISSVVSARDMVGTGYRDVKVPLLTWESDLFDSLRFTGQRKGVDFGEVEKEHYINIVNAPSPLAGGVTAGKHWVYPRDQEMGWGKPAPGATVIATIPGEPRHAVLFAYEKGATMDYDFIAPARRVAVFLGNRTFEHLSQDGSAMFDAAVRWALSER